MEGKVMKKIGDYKIGLKFNLLITISLVIVFIAFGIYIINKQKSKIISDTQIRMTEHVNDLAEIIKLQINKNQLAVSSLSNIVFDIFKTRGELKYHENRTQTIEAVNQETKESKTFTVKALEYNGSDVFQNYSFVDDIQQKTNSTATIFQRIDDGFLRISTNIKKLDGNRATGTYIPNHSPVIQTILKGETYQGRAFVVNDWYLTSYVPILIDGSVEAILYIGVNEKDMAGLKDIFLQKKYFDSGFPFLVDSDGDLIIHPESQGMNIAEEPFFEEMKNNSQNVEEIDYTWEGSQKKVFYYYVEQIDSYLVASLLTEEIMSPIKTTRNSVIIAILIVLSLIVVIINLIVRAISKGLSKGVLFAQQVARGDLSQQIDIDQQDEVGQLAKALNLMVVNLKEIVSNIIQGAESIASASEQVRNNSVRLSEGASEQASSIEEVSSTMEEIAANIEQNTENSLQTEKVSSETNVEIKGVASKSNQAVVANKEIANKITIINDIAFQTNLLALNAAVEAARAGEHGKGFAVVAAEVRKLAENSKVAAEEIVQLANTGLKISEEAGEVMQGIIPKVENTSKLIQEISAASSEQNNGTAQVNGAIQQLNNVTQQNVEASEELATSAEEMSSQAQQLKDMISFFAVSNKDNLKIDLR